ncbi:MAG: hypothetical protein JW958_13105 [Candidatus Eisenbacteria bacterium]|nr:hypothetical protein [Candidatus Eisenbacteria bacterium]
MRVKPTIDGKDRRPPISPGKTLLFSVITVVLFFLLLEGAARLLLRPDEAPTHREHEKLIRVLGLPGLTEILEPDPVLFWKLRAGVRNKRIAGALGGYGVDFTASTNDEGYRSPPFRSGDTFRVIALGNSCTFGVGVGDDQTWPRLLEERMRLFHGPDAEVVNAGVPGYTAYQGLRWLGRRGLALDPDLVLLCFGFNDAATWASRTDRETARALDAERFAAPLLRRSALAAALSRTARRLRGDDDSRGADSDEPAGETPRLPPGDFVKTLVEMKRLCDARGVPVIYLIWPYRKQKEEGSADLIVYQPGVVAAARETESPIISLIEPFLRAEGDLFIDNIHPSAAGCSVAAEAIATRLEMARGGGAR